MMNRATQIMVMARQFSRRNTIVPPAFFICLAAGVLFLIGCSSESFEEKEIELEWNQEDGYRWAELSIDESGRPGFKKLPSSYTNIRMNNFLSEELMEENRVLMNGSGVAAGDINGNGLVDLYFTRLDGPNTLYENLGGFRFRDITEQAGAAHDGHYSTGAVFADVNGNGHLDLLITTLDSENVLYLNDGEGNFKLKEDSGLGQAQGSMTMALADVNGNGYLDLYIVNYREINVIDVFDAPDLVWENTIRNGELIAPYDDFFTIIDRGEGFTPERHEIGRNDELFLNNGDGSFSKVTNPETVFLAEDGSPLGLYPDWGLAAKFQDLNGNGLPDLYVCNDFWTPDRVWINQGDGTFRAIDTLAMRNSSYYSMTVDFSDINRNGFIDIFTVEMLNDKHTDRLRKRMPVEPLPLRMGEYENRPRYNRNSLFLNRGDHTYAEISYLSGLHASEWSWATRFIDLNLDGYEDVIINTGFAFDFQDLDSQQQLFESLVETRGAPRGYIEDFIPLRQQNRIFQNNGDLTFTNVSSEWGFNDMDISLGMALADLNGNGVLDVVISRMNDEPAVYKNTAPGARIAIRLKGSSPNTQAVGAKLELEGGPVDRQSKQIAGGGDYLSGSDPLIVFAANDENTDHRLLISWPDGTQSSLDGLHPNRVYEIEQAAIGVPEAAQPGEAAADSAVTDVRVTSMTPLFEDVTAWLGHHHHEDPYDDFRIQPLLPIKLSQLGPGLAWLDLTGDGRDELIIGTGKGGKPGVYRIRDDGQPEPLDVGLSREPAPGDQAGIVGWSTEGRTHLVTGLANYEIGTTRSPSALHYQFENGQVASVDSLPGTLSATGPLAAADYSGNGSVDLFIGGRFLPGQYPADATSRLFRNEGGNLVPDRENSAVLENLGLVTGAVFADYNLNGEQDLIVATEWGTIRIFENNGGRFTEKTSELGLGNYKGWWQGIATGDFNGNGYPDLVAANWGENSPYQVGDPDRPLRMYYGDFNQNRRVDIVEAYFNPDAGDYVPRRKLTDYEHIQDILWHAGSHEQFSEFTVTDMLRRDPDRIPYKELNTLQHMIFINNGGNGFSAQPLPAEAQFSAGFYVGVADADNDGNEDIFISQNFFPVARPQSNPRLDGGRGLWLKGDGSGNFEAIPGHLSRVKIYGEQRGAVLGDFTGDGRTDLAVSQNNAETRLFVNRSAERGIRIRLSGPPANRNGFGSSIRIVYQDGSKGPSRLIQAGSGYWSQNSATQVLGASRPLAAIEIRWFDGTIQRVEIDDRADYVVQYGS